MKSLKLRDLNWLDESAGILPPLTLLGSTAITAKPSITRLSAFHELQPRGNPLVYVFFGLHRGEPGGLVLQGLVRREPGQSTPILPCNQVLVLRLPMPHALAWMGFAPAGNPSLVAPTTHWLSHSGTGGERGCPNSTLTARMTVFLFKGAMPANIMVTFG